MSLFSQPFYKMHRLIYSTTVRAYASSSNSGISKGPSSSQASSPSPKPSSNVPNVPGLSSKVCNVPSSEVGPGASKSSGYKNPEYFCYDKSSYFEAEVEMLKYRCPQPSNKLSSA